MDEIHIDDDEDALKAISTRNSVGDSPIKEENDATLTIATEALCPSHILPDGTYVHLPPPSEFERTRFFETSVARHGLLQDDLQASHKRTLENTDISDGNEKNANEKKTKAGKVESQTHPLALASARMQSNGINELNRAINLQTLVATGEYFGLSNIVDPTFDLVSGKTISKVESGGNGPENTGSTGAPPGVSIEEEAQVRAFYVLQRKNDIYRHATTTLKRHRRRLIAAIVSQKQIDKRWRELRPLWRLAAPEHGTRALPHAVKTTEVVCADVDVYHFTGSQIGRLSCHVPRYASIELSEEYTVGPDIKDWQTEKLAKKRADEPLMQICDDPMDIESDLLSRKESTPPVDPKMRDCTKAHPFAIADPSIGKVDVDFDPSKVVMLTLQFEIVKPSTGYSENVCLEPVATTLPKSADVNATISDDQRDDEQLLMRLQHSLFCAKLFESMRRELAPDMENTGHVRSPSVQPQSVAWLTGRSDENFLPPPSMMIGANQPGLSPLCVIYVQNGNFKVMLDCEYTLNVKLVDSSVSFLTDREKSSSNNSAGPCTESGSRTPSQLRTLCQALILHAQETYHRHSVQTEVKLYEEQHEMEKKKLSFLTVNPRVEIVLPVKNRGDVLSSKSLQECTSLGAKLLFESRIRKTLRKVKDWLPTIVATPDDKFVVEWLMLPMFDLAAQFTVSFRDWCVDANIACDELTITRFGTKGEYRKIKFYSDKQFELYLKIALRRAMME